MASEISGEQRGRISSFSQKLESSLRPLSRAFLDWAEKTVTNYPQLKGVVETMKIDRLFGPRAYPPEPEVQAKMDAVKAVSARRHAESHRLHLWFLAASAGGLAVAAVYGYLQESGIINNADVSAVDNQPNPTEAAPAGIVETLAATATQMPPTEIFIPATATLTPEPIAEPTPAYRESLTPDQQTIYDVAPIQAGLEKQFLAGGLSDYLAYRDGSGEVTAIYDPELQKVFPALLNGDDNLFINEGSTGATIVYNPELETDEAVKNAGLVMDYVRARLCARALGLNPPATVEKITPFMESISGQTCNVTLRAVSERINVPNVPGVSDWSYRVSKQTITLTNQTPIVVKFTDSEMGLGEKGNRQMYLNYGVDRETGQVKSIEGVTVKQSAANRPVEVNIFHKGGFLPAGYDYFASWLEFSIAATFDRAGIFQDFGQRDPVLEAILLNDWDSPKGSDGIYDGFQISPLTFGRKFPS